MTLHAHCRDRRIGPTGTIARGAVGLAFVIVPIALGGIRWLDVAALAAYGLIATATITAITAGLQRRQPRGPGIGLECCVPAALVGEAVALRTVVPANVNMVVGSFLGISMLLAAAGGYSGCELTALPNAVAGRRDHVGCLLFAPIDAAESRRQS